jgi:acyl-CoA thioesterase-2
MKGGPETGRRETPPAATPASVTRLLEILELERLDRDLFRAAASPHMGGRRLFGGQVAAQALRAATFTVQTDHLPHSLHAYFLRPGDPEHPVLLHVDRIRDGRSFTTRRVVAVQEGEAIFHLGASFQRDEEGAEYTEPGPLGVPDPESDHPWSTSPFSAYESHSPFEMRELEVGGPDERGVYESTRRIWIRTRGRLPDDRPLHCCVATFVSDMGVVYAAAVPIGGPFGAVTAASLDHAVWFHRPLRLDEWTLFDVHPISNARSRGLVRGSLRARDGALGASIAQEALIRRRPETEKP